MKKRLAALLMTLVMLFNFTGCKKSAKEENVKLTMYLWDKSMTMELTPWLENKFPEIDFTFVVGYNSMDFYKDLEKRGEFPDIITCRRFSLNDAAHLSDSLLDLSQTNVAGSFYDSYIENNRESSGAIRWLPMCAEVDGYIANVDLFEKYGIAIPTNYDEFTEVCRKFDELGLRCYVNDYREDYSCMEALQGCAIPELMSMDGIMWRSEYENETSDGQVGLDSKVWPVVFDKFERYIQDTMIKPEDLEMSFAQMKSDILDGKIAIMRGTASNCSVFRKENGINAVMLPYFGETSEDNWLLTYPSCQVAVNKDVEKDDKKTEAVMKVLEAMFSEEGQRHVAVDNAMLSYNKNVDLEIGDEFSQVTDCIDRNHLYIRLASTEMFAVSKEIVHKMISGEYGAKEGYDSFNERLTSAKSCETCDIITTQNTAYAYAFGEHGSPAASAVLNTLRRQWGSDIAVGYSSVVASPVFAGEYSRDQLNRLLANRLIFRSGELTGAELKEYMQWLVNVKEDGSNPIRHSNLIPVTSGFEYELTEHEDGTYTLDNITINGKPIDYKKTYKVMSIGDDDYIEAPYYCNCPMPNKLNEKMDIMENNIYDLFVSALEGGKQLEPPSEYVTVIK
ncbi:MAG: 5'-nucleotidase C-terminal domain-containing protein [Oscillospiraceae bacterium]